MNKFYLIFLLSSIGFSVSAMAECPSNLTAEETIDCVVIEGATSSYSDYSNEIENPQDIAETQSTTETTKEKAELASVQIKE